MEYYKLKYKEVLTNLNSSKDGISEQEALKRLANNGKNKLEESKKESKIQKFLEQFYDLMIIILIISAIISFILAILNNESFIDSIIILAIVIINATMGFVQELKADKALESLKKMQLTKVKVKREGKIHIINSEDIVKGDVLVLEAGDQVCADARIFWESSLKVDESSLTGESIPVVKNIDEINKDVPLSLRSNMIYSGTNVVYGKCLAVVCATGMETEFGLIAKSLNTEERESTPLQKKITDISKFLSIIIAIIIVIMFIIGLIKGMKLLEIIMLSISLAVAAIPEGLPAVITIILSLGMSDLAKKKAIIRKMSSVETLGCTEIICSDKTGTITQNKMTVREIIYNNNILNSDDIENDNFLLKIMALNNDVEKNNDEYIGDPTEIALYNFCEKYFDIEKVKNKNPRIDEIPFDSERKMMSTINKDTNNITLYTKGSFDSIISNCKYVYENNKIVKLTKSKLEKLRELENQECAKAYRILAYAFKSLDNNYKKDNLENNLVFVGLTAMIDPPRDDVKEAIQSCKEAHIRPIMITGDSLRTAVSIAKEIGILEDEKEAITGLELDKMDKKELQDKITNYSVYARVSPTNKLEIVEAWKSNNKVVAMTGDGVNDAPALKAANIGVGMGITGTEVSKNVSDIILTDDGFSTIVSAVKEGRRIFDNIRNVLVYLLTGNIVEILVVFIGMLMGIEIFLPIQLLYINLITDGIPAIALAFEIPDDDVMKRDVRKKDSSFFTPFLISKMLIAAVLKTLAIMLIFFVNLKLNGLEIASTMAFLTLILVEMVFAYSCRNLKKKVLNNKIFANKQLNKSIMFLFIIQIIIFTTPLKKIFQITSINFLQLAYTLIVVLVVFLIDEMIKKIIAKKFKD